MRSTDQLGIGLIPWRAAMLRAVSLCFSFVVGASLSNGVESYKPREVGGIAGLWNWGKIEGLEGDFIDCVEPSEDGSLWIGIGSKVVRYDGTSFREYDSFSSRPSALRAIKETTQGEVYLMTRAELFRLKGEEWELVSRTGENQGRRLQEDKDGRVWFAGSGRLYSVLGDEILESESFAQRILDIEFDRAGKLWVLDAVGDTYRCLVEGGHVVVERRWAASRSRSRRQAGYGMLEATSDGKIWVVDSFSGSPPKNLDTKTGEWSSIDFGDRDAGSGR